MLDENPDPRQNRNGVVMPSLDDDSQTLQGAGPLNSTDRLIEETTERQPTKRRRPLNCADFLIEAEAEGKLLQRCWPGNRGDRLVELAAEG